MFTETLERGAARPGHQAWEWSGRWALFHVGERGRGGGPAMVDAVEPFLDEVHALVPIVDVAYFNACGSTDAWDEWSVAQGPPDPGPFRLTLAGQFHRAHDPALPEPGTREAFEAGRHAKAHAAARRALDEAVAKQAKKPIRVEPLQADDLPERPPAFVWPDADLGAFDVPEPQALQYTDPSGKVWDEWQAGDHPLNDVPGRPLAWVVPQAGQAADNLAWIDDEGARRTATRWKPPVKDARFREAIVHGSGAYAIVTVNRMEYLQVKAQVIYHVDFEAGRARAIHTCDPQADGGLGRVAFVLAGDDRLAVSTTKRLFLLDPTAAKPTPIAPVKQAGGALVPVFEGRALLAETSRSWRIYGVTPDAIKKLGTFTDLVRFDFERDGRVYLTSAGPPFELVGARAAVDRFVARVAKAAPPAQ